MNHGDTLFTGYRFRVERAIQTTADGVQHPRDVIRHPGAVTILPILDDGRICFVKNYRVAVDETLIELPAGTLEKNELPIVTAGRELAEETGYRAGQIEQLTDFYMSPGILDEKMYFFLATSLTPGEMQLEPGEEIQTMLVGREEALQMVRDGRIHDSKTMLGLLYYEVFRRAAS
jgi:ADP-ribose pyrophosphatase